MGLISAVFVFNLCVIIGNSIAEEETWTGRWLPERTTQAPEEEKNSRMLMGIVDTHCDDAKSHLEIDWFDDIVNYTCFEQRTLYKTSFDRRPLIEKENIPAMYQADHACMNESISYLRPIPTFGTHRPLWPQWGEFIFVPVQRWLHNLEHGGIVMLYHPCANKLEVNMLKKIVSQCLYRHVITPSTDLSPARPLALVAWGVRLQMSAVAQDVVVDFIRQNALNGPEHTYREGQYTHEMIKHAEVVSTVDDSKLCPNF